jgi:chemotaxis signal transduction protein
MSIQSNNKFLKVSIGSDSVHIPIGSVVEVSKGRIDRILPGTIDGFVGMTRLRGQILGVMALNNTSKQESDMVVIKTSKASFALVADEIHGILEIPFDPVDIQSRGLFIGTHEDMNFLDVASIERVIG